MESNVRMFIFLLLFAWNLYRVSSVSDYHDPHCGGRQVIVHLFEWKWTDIAAECERYLGPKGFCGVQVSPPMEHTIITKDAHRPWWERYQPVSYKLTSRSGNEAQFKDMTERCKKVGVRIYVDAVVNHMAGLGRTGVGSAGSTFDSSAFDFPGVPFSKPNFNDRSKCPSHDGNVNNYGDPNNVRNCYLVGLTDLDGSQAYVQDKVAGYFNHLIDLGVAGFRVDAAKHMWPADLAATQAKTKDLPEGGRPFFYLEVIDRNDGAIKVNEYFKEGYVTEFRYAQKVKEGANDLGRLGAVYDPGWGMAPPDQAFVFVDNHDTQRGNQALTYKDGDSYKRAVAFTIAYNYGFVRVMSSYEFSNNEQGPPANGDDTTKDVPINSDGSCGNTWVCEHRWRPIGNMARFRSFVDGTDVQNWRYQNGVLSFSRGNKGFFAMGTRDFSETVQTGLPAGEYCDLISDCAIKIKVDGSGSANIKPASGSEPFVAFVNGDPDANLPKPQNPSLPTQPPVTPQPSSVSTQSQGVTPQSPGATSQAPSGAVTPNTPVWLENSDPYHDPHCGGRQVIVHLFEWKWTDIAAECERYLGPKGFCGVQVSPPMEHTIITKEAHRPWWERYQPVSYKLTSRSGNEAQFKDMTERCKKVGVRIYVDAVVNHMAGLGRVGTGSAGSHFDSSAFDFPGVPFTKPNFNDRSKCPSGDGNVNNYGDPNNVRNCYLVGLTDLDGSQAYVQDKVAGYLNHLIDLGVAGFRVDAAKHMWPADLAAMQAKTKDLPYGGRPFFYLEVIDRNDGAIKVNEYFKEGYVTEFRYAQKVKEGANDLGKLHGVYDPGWGMAPSGQAFIFVDNHDTQRGNQALTYKNGDEYRRAVAFTIAYNYGFVRVMSSYEFSNNEQGPPANGDGTTKDVPINADGSCGNTWVCEHRWPSIGNLVAFRNHVAGTDVQNWNYEAGVLSFSRGNKGFFAMGSRDFTKSVNTGLPAGEYCDLISECAVKIQVDGSGNANVRPASGSQPYVAIVNGKIDNTVTAKPVTGGPTGPATGPTQPPVVTTGYQRTVILIERATMPGQDLFIRGGIDHAHRDGCTNVASTSACSIPIKPNTPGSSQHFAKVNAWSDGDNFLDWVGAEPGQASFQGRPAEGTPAYWSTNDASHAGYSQLNTYGPHYWVVDIQMDCSKTENGFFEFKAIVNGGWEADITQSGTCPGPYLSKNHFAKCGYVNVYHWGSGTCDIHAIQ